MPPRATKTPILRGNLGLVCITRGPEIRYRMITRTRLLALPPADQRRTLHELYTDNLKTLFSAMDFCRQNNIHLYRCTSALLPQMDHPVAREVIEDLTPVMSRFAPLAKAAGVRVLLHPDQFVVLNSDSLAVRAQSKAIFDQFADIFDRLALPRSAWAPMILHGGKGGRPQQMIDAIATLTPAARARIVLENDEHIYSASEILDICRRAKVPMVFDAHHHIVHEALTSYDHESVAKFTTAARTTWPDPAWQLVHLSNGKEFFADPRHSDLITRAPAAFSDVPWVEIEAKGKEEALAALRTSPRAKRHAPTKALQGAAGAQR